MTRALEGPDGFPVRKVDSTCPRVGLTVGKVIGKAVDRNRIKRRLREAIRQNASLLPCPVDVILHPRRSTINLDFVALNNEVRSVFQAIQRHINRETSAAPERRRVPDDPDRMRVPRPRLPSGFQP